MCWTDVLDEPMQACVFSVEGCSWGKALPRKLFPHGCPKLGSWHCSREELYSDATEFMGCEALVVEKQNILFLCRMENKW